MTVSLDIIQLAADALNQTTVAGKSAKAASFLRYFPLTLLTLKTLKTTICNYLHPHRLAETRRRHPRTAPTSTYAAYTLLPWAGASPSCPRHASSAREDRAHWLAVEEGIHSLPWSGVACAVAAHTFLFPGAREAPSGSGTGDVAGRKRSGLLRA